MSYLVLARKWRPQTFDDLIGQEHVARTLGNAIASGRIHHAYLFTGARGVGKTSAARILAKALNCEAGLTATPCNSCPSCLEITAGQGLDVFEIDGASNTGVDDIRELRENIRYLPSRSRYKIFIIDEVHMLSINAFNALLKTLEEPPPHAKFVFATTEPHKIPATILSRCQRFDFRKIALPSVVASLRRIVDAEGIVISDRALTLVARRGEGSMRDSLSTLDQVLAFCGLQVADDDVQGLLGMVDRRLLLDAAESIIAHDSRMALETLRRIDDLGHSFRQFCQQLVEILRALVLLKVVEEPRELLDVTEDELLQLRELAARGTLEEHQRALTLLLKTEGELASSSSPRLTLEMALVRLCHLPAARDIGLLLARFEDLERRLAKTPVAVTTGNVPRPSTAPPSPPPAVPRERREAPPPKKTEAPVPAAGASRSWPGLVDHIRRHRRPRLALILEQASLLELAPPLLRFALPRDSFYFQQLQDSDLQRELQELAADFFGTKMEVRLTPLGDGDSPVPPSLHQERQVQEHDRDRQLREEALGHPVVKAACEIFDGEVLAVRALDSAGDTADETQE